MPPIIRFYATHFLLAFVGCLVAAPVVADQATAWLDRMSHGFQELNYRGTFSYQRGERINSLRITHAVIDGSEYERLEHLDGDRRDVIRRGHDVKCVHPGHRLIRAWSTVAPTDATGGDRPAIGDLYEVTVVGQDRVAGHRAVNLQLLPKDDYRFGYRLSLDEQTALLLRSELLGEEQQVLERFQFVELEIGMEIPLSAFDDVAHGYATGHGAGSSERKAQDQFSAPTESPDWEVSWLPRGFAATPVRVTRRGDTMKTFTDGLAVFSVFVEPAEASQDSSGVTEGQARKGATTAYFTTLQLDGQPRRVTVVGEVPQQTARDVAASVVLVSAR